MGRGMVKPRKSITMRAAAPYCTNVVTRSNRVSGFRDPTWCRVTIAVPPFSSATCPGAPPERGDHTKGWMTRLDHPPLATDRAEGQIGRRTGHLPADPPGLPGPVSAGRLYGQL